MSDSDSEDIGSNPIEASNQIYRLMSKLQIKIKSAIEQIEKEVAESMKKHGGKR